MGNEVSSESSMLTSEEINRLRLRFSRIDTDQSGSLTKDEILNIPGLKQNPLVGRVLEVFDSDRNGEIDLKEFINGIALFSSKGNNENKIRFIFDIYDINRDGFITNGELFTVLKAMVGSNLNDEQLQQIVDKTMVAYDTDNDGRISYQEFKSKAESITVFNSMCLDI
ncbi:Calcineurin subunit B [Thelohanellus kitauei]|uniref:Calcineurin subunit B n=1 Tax=Thelohanellus kitauei TaxID=669202 RepID=A0A0C2MNP1_THEKT|nr:Calcineurin subunit B [Thelohanellus kitauei]